MKSYARAGSDLGLNIKKPGIENGKVIIFSGTDGVRKMRALTSDTKHINPLFPFYEIWSGGSSAW